MIDLLDVAKRFDSGGLEKLTLHVAEGTRLAVLGPSGCGKSTLLRLVVGLAVPDVGEVRIGGVAMTPKSAQSLRRTMGYVIQEGGLFPHLTARGNVALLARHLGWDEARIEARLAELLELVRLAKSTLDALPAELSGGQRQRVSLMRALFLEPKVVLLDEPLGALDPVVRAHLQDDLLRVLEGRTTLLVTHDLAEAARLCDDIALLRAGRVVQRGTFAELSAHPADAEVEEFLAAPRMLSLPVAAS